MRDKAALSIAHTEARTDYLEIAWEPVSQLLCVQGYLGVQVDGRRVLQQLALALDCIHHLGVAVPHADRDNARKRLHLKFRELRRRPRDQNSSLSGGTPASEEASRPAKVL